ncbi:TPA: type 1 fimbrial protein [Citrobacter amalonaticus]|nr:type 1 fimbrial protein [Citrobacter amalonaticus]
MKYLSYSVLASALLMSGVSHATNTITFTGTITDATCEVALQDATGTQISATGSGDITLNEVSKADLSAANSVAGPTRFSIVAKNCVLGESGKSRISASFMSNNADNQGYLNNTATAETGAASGVQLKLLDSAQKFIKVNDPAQADTATWIDIVTEDPATTVMPFYVEYYSAPGSATGGTITSKVTYELIYD